MIYLRINMVLEVQLLVMLTTPLNLKYNVSLIISKAICCFKLCLLPYEWDFLPLPPPTSKYVQLVSLGLVMCQLLLALSLVFWRNGASSMAICWQKLFSLCSLYLLMASFIHAAIYELDWTECDTSQSLNILSSSFV